ncbi:sel1 repeat family protein [Akkermansia glycaniphila]|uniref:tetratricopeptide repeat protein n=1 Tax=Akkermansia glycaniphila TaxID=1679444 RepID=UPI001C035076|nr:hypothetical protein [Akkermansia glycaniphila]MBT9450002.1 sel1 repeat family protein [Akkermansia glycaniphila]
MKRFLAIFVCTCLYGSVFADDKRIDSEKVLVVAPIIEGARKGDALAQYVAGLLYMDAIIVNKDSESAKKYLLNAFHQDPQKYADAGGMVGMTWFGKDDIEDSKNYLREAARYGDSSSLKVLSIIDDSNDMLLKSAEAGDANSMAILGMGYFTGKKGFSKDEAKGFYWLKRAIDFGKEEPEFLIKIAQCYITGTGTKKDELLGLSILKQMDERANTEESALLLADAYSVCNKKHQSLYWAMRALGRANEPNNEFYRSIVEKILQNEQR